MSKPSIAEVADAVIAELNDPARAWVQAFKADRVWFERDKSADLKQMQIRVAAVSSTQQLHNRGYRRRDHAIAIAFRKNVNPDNVAAVDALAAFVENVADYYGADSVNAGARKVAGTEAMVTGVLIDPIVSPDELDTNQRFFSVITLTIVEIASVIPPGA